MSVPKLTALLAWLPPNRSPPKETEVPDTPHEGARVQTPGARGPVFTVKERRFEGRLPGGAVKSWTGYVPGESPEGTRMTTLPSNQLSVQGNSASVLLPVTGSVNSTRPRTVPKCAPNNVTKLPTGPAFGDNAPT